jgi:hypothetical protein
MMCPYQGFKECKWDDCAARMYVLHSGGTKYYMKVCALAYNGAPIPAPAKEDKNED